MSEEVEIYDSSDSELSSNEYDNDEDDDSLMDAAISKQTTAPTDAKSSNKQQLSPTKSTSTGGGSSSTDTTPRKLTTNDIMSPPENREQTERRNKCLQRNSRLCIHYKHLSMRFFKLHKQRGNYLERLKEIMPARIKRSHRRKELTYGEQKRNNQQLEIKMRQKELERIHRGRITPELICLDDTENEESPEKQKPIKNNVVDTPIKEEAVVVVVEEQQQQQQLHQQSAVIIQQESSPPAQATAAATTPRVENGSVLYEFLNMKTTTQVENESLQPATYPAAVEITTTTIEQCVVPVEQELNLINRASEWEKSYTQPVAAELAYNIMHTPKPPVQSIEKVDKALDELHATLKRRRSVSPSAPVATAAGVVVIPTVNGDGKRTKQQTQSPHDVDDIVDVMPNDVSTAEQSQTLDQHRHHHQQQQQLQQHHHQHQQQLPQATTPTPVGGRNVDTSNVSTAAFHLGMPFSLAPAQAPPQAQRPIQPPPPSSSSNNDYYVHQQQLPSSSFSLDTPTPTDEPMEIVYPQQQQSVTVQPSTSSSTSFYNASNEMKVSQIPEPTPVPTNLSLSQPLQPPPTSSSVQQHLQQHQQQPSELNFTVTNVNQSTPQQQQQQQQRAKAEKLPITTATVITTPPPAAAAAAAETTTVEETASNLNNSDASFHQDVKSLYQKFDQAMTAKLRSVNPTLQEYKDEKVRIAADMKTLDELIAQKEDDYNRLLHLRHVKLELYARLERKERLMVMKEILPCILNKHCSTTDLYDFESMLNKEQNASMPVRRGLSTMEQFINKLECKQNDVNNLRSVLGFTEPSSSSSQFYTAVRSQTAGLHNVVDDNDDDHRYRRNSLPTERMPHKYSYSLHHQQPPQRQQQELLPPPLLQQTRLPQSFAKMYGNETRQQQQQQRQQHYSFDSPFDSNKHHRPMFNSTKTGIHHQQQYNEPPRRHALNNSHSIDRSNAITDTARLLLSELGDRVNDASASLHRSRNKLTGSGGLTNGPKENYCCNQCEINEATFVCTGCYTQAYCSQECQLKAWETHRERCAN